MNSSAYLGLPGMALGRLAAIARHHRPLTTATAALARPRAGRCTACLPIAVQSRRSD